MSDRASLLRANLDQTLNELARLESRPKEPAQDIPDAVIYFDKYFGVAPGTQSNVPYQYGATRAKNGRWYTSSQAGPNCYYTWDQLMDFIEESETERPQIWMATEWQEVL